MLNRSIICKVANQLHKSGYTLSQSFRLAWRLAKGKASVKVAGVTKGNRQQVIDYIKQYSPKMVSFILKREPTNKYDCNAISVYARVGNGNLFQMGYIPAVVSNLLCGVIDNITSIKATLQAITGGFYVDMVQGIRLHLSTEE